MIFLLYNFYHPDLFVTLVKHLLLLNGSLLGHVDSVKELTKILLTDGSGLLDTCAGEGYGSNVVSAQLNLILNIGRTNVLNSFEKRNLTYTLLSQEVTNLNITGVGGNVDGEMRVNETHLVDESLGYSDEQVLNVRADSTNGSKLLTLCEPNIKTDHVLSNALKVHVYMLEVTGKGSTGSSDGYETGLDGYRNSLRDLNTTG